MEEMQLDFSSDNTTAGFRLHRFEVLNWGTFDQKIWNIGPEGHSSLVTGDIGSGKTTLVDGIATLLVPPGKTIYNRTASGETGNNKERNKYSYVRGEYKKVRGEESGKAEAEYLRSENTYSVLLAYFYNEGFYEKVTLAQVYSIRNHKVETFFVVSSDSLTIQQDFTNFGTDIKSLKERLSKTPNTKTYSEFTDYGSRFRQIFGGLSEEAFILFRDTISTKQIVDLTSFVKSLMLEKSDKTLATIDDLCNSFDNLNHAYNAVAKAKDQIEMLKPIVDDGSRYQDQEQSLVSVTACREAVPSYFSRFEKTLLEAKIQKTEQDIEKTEGKVKALEENLVKHRQRESVLKKNIDAAGGGLLEKIEERIIELEQDRDRRKETNDKYQACLKHINLPAVHAETDFYATRSLVEELLDEIEGKRTENDNHLYNAKVELDQKSVQMVSVGKEIDHLKKRKSNIPGKSLEIRTAICEALQIDEDELPFAGELIRVIEQEKEWQGAIERVLHGFGLSLLVSDDLYSKVSAYVDQTNLRGRLVYYRIRKDDGKKSYRDIDPHSVVRKLDFKDDSPLYEGLVTRLNDQYADIICCKSIEQFRKNEKAVTLQGQIKQGRKHEKDDRKALNDSRDFILGWNNKEKLSALENELDQLFHDRNTLDKKITGLRGVKSELETHRDIANKFEAYTSFKDIDWESIVKEIELQLIKKREIEESSNVIETLKKQLNDVVIDIRRDDEDRKQAEKESGRLEKTLESEKESLLRAISRIDPRYEPVWPTMDSLAKEQLSTTKYTLENIKRLSDELTRHLHTEMERWKKQNANLRDKIISSMTRYCTKYEADCKEINAEIGSLDEFSKVLRKLEEEDLPRHIDNFRRMLREETINGLALLSNELDKSSNDIIDRIKWINLSLKEIEYNPGRYIKLMPDKHIDREISEFNFMVKDCLSGTIGDADEIYTEERFCKVRDIVLRLRSDIVWTKKVTDVRNWFTFSARENLREDDSEWETYDDTTGKSGGQKEKLAYTILASALAYQFGLSWGEKQSRSLRFIAVDEAFGRMSEESTRYGLELFKKLNLQFLIITPLQKINVIESYVKNIHYVHNYEGKKSVVRKMSIVEYQAKKEQILSDREKIKLTQEVLGDHAE